MTKPFLNLTHSHTATRNVLILHPSRNSNSVSIKQGELEMVNCILEHVILIYKVIQSGKEKKRISGSNICWKLDSTCVSLIQSIRKHGRETRMKCHFSRTECHRSEFLNSCTMNTGSHIMLFCWEYLMYCKVFSSISGLYPPDPSTKHCPSSICNNWKFLQTLSNISWGTKSPRIENHCHRWMFTKPEIIWEAIHITLPPSCKADPSPQKYFWARARERLNPWILTTEYSEILRRITSVKRSYRL